MRDARSISIRVDQGRYRNGVTCTYTLVIRVMLHRKRDMPGDYSMIASCLRSVCNHVCELLSAYLGYINTTISKTPQMVFQCMTWFDYGHGEGRTFPSIIYLKPSDTLAKPFGSTSFGEGLILPEARMSFASFQISIPCLRSSAEGVHFCGRGK